MRGQNFSSQVLIGLVLMLIGFVWLLNNLGWIDFSGLTRWIPSIFILLGVWQLVTNKFRFITGPLILVIGGVLFQLAAFNVLAIESVLNLWPLLLIVIGGSILLERSGVRPPRLFRHNEDENEVSILAIFNGPEHAVTSPAFKGGETTAILGGIDFDLRQADVEERPARINAFAMFGGVDIIVPEVWAVETNVLGFFGGVDDERKQKPVSQTGQPEILVTGFAMFGGITIKSK